MILVALAGCNTLMGWRGDEVRAQALPALERSIVWAAAHSATQAPCRDAAVVGPLRDFCSRPRVEGWKQVREAGGTAVCWCPPREESRLQGKLGNRHWDLSLQGALPGQSALARAEHHSETSLMLALAEEGATAESRVVDALLRSKKKNVVSRHELGWKLIENGSSCHTVDISGVALRQELGERERTTLRGCGAHE